MSGVLFPKQLSAYQLLCYPKHLKPYLSQRGVITTRRPLTHTDSFTLFLHLLTASCSPPLVYRNLSSHYGVLLLRGTCAPVFTLPLNWTPPLEMHWRLTVMSRAVETFSPRRSSTAIATNAMARLLPASIAWSTFPALHTSLIRYVLCLLWYM